MTKSRSELEEIFVTDTILNEDNFADLIDAGANAKDDRLRRAIGGGIQLAAEASGTRRALAFYGSWPADAPEWVASLAPEDEDGSPVAGLSLSRQEGRSRLFIDEATGHVGLGTVAPASPLTVVGGMRSEGLEVGDTLSIDAEGVPRLGGEPPFTFQVLEGTGSETTISTGLSCADWIVLATGFEASSGEATAPGGATVWPFEGRDGHWHVATRLEDIDELTFKTSVVALRREVVHVSGRLPTAPVKKPGPPSFVHAVAGDGEAVVTLGAPADTGGGTIDHYAVSVVGFERVTTGPSPVTVEHLQNGQSYQFVARAHNEAGYGPPTGASDPIVTWPPRWPRITGVRVTEDDRCNVEFLYPAHFDPEIQFYAQISFDPHEARPATMPSYPPTQPSHEQRGHALTGYLLPHEQEEWYAFLVVENRYDSNSWERTRPFFSFAAPPTAPRIAGVEPGDAQVTVHFTPPEQGAQGVTGYTALSNDGHTGHVDDSGTSVVVAGLVNGNSYTFTVIAHSPTGDSPASDASDSVIPWPPHVPRITSAELYSTASPYLYGVHLRFERPAIIEAGFQGYVPMSFTQQTGGQAFYPGHRVTDPNATEMYFVTSAGASDYFFIVTAEYHNVLHEPNTRRLHARRPGT